MLTIHSKKEFIFLNILFLSLQFSFGQFVLDGEFRPRTEFRHGFGSLIPAEEDPGFATATRARLNASYAFESYRFHLSIQDVMVWGENRQILPDDQNDSFAIFEAWADIDLGNGFSSKLGRQTISYDDQRIFGGLDWAQQGRNHDAAIVTYKKEKFHLDLGIAFNQDFDNPSGFQSIGTEYNTTGFFSYKTMQYVYLKKQWENLNGSLLLLNNGFQNFEADGTTGDGVSNLQTLGTHINFKKNNFKASLNAFLQTGERQGSVKVGGAYLLGLELAHKTSTKITLGLGAELISGNNPGTSEKTEAFFPLFGTNHKFNGFMDYFYVGNHANSIGLFDLHASAKLSLGEKSNLFLKILNFSGEQELASGTSSLGTELDMVYTQKFNGFLLKVGYSHLFPSDGMYELKGIPENIASNTQNWAWAMLVIKPKFLNTASKT